LTATTTARYCLRSYQKPDHTGHPFKRCLQRGAGDGHAYPGQGRERNRCNRCRGYHGHLRSRNADGTPVRNPQAGLWQRPLPASLRADRFQAVISCRIPHSGYLRSRRATAPISGETISNELKITRVAVWKHINELRTMGYDISSSQKEGYRLTHTSNKLLPYEVHKKTQDAVHR